MIRHILLLALLVQAGANAAIQHTGLVRSADQPIPGATVTAVQGGARLSAITDENGLYALDLTPGPWDLEVEIYGFETARRSIYMSFKDFSPTTLDWVMELKGHGEGAAAANGGFQTLDLTQHAHVEAQMAATAAEMEAADAAPHPEAPAASANDAFLVSGSLSRGLQEAPPDDPKQLQPTKKRKAETGSTGIAGYAVSAPAGRVEGFEGSGGGRTSRAGGSSKSAGGRAGGSKKMAGGKKGSRRNSAASFGNKRPDPGVIRGSAYLNMRDSGFDARPFSLSGQTLPKPEYSQYRMGLSAGGQLRIPHILESERAFFYFNYTGSRSRQPYQSVVTLPSQAEREGDFSQSMTRWPVQVFDPDSKLPFPDNRIPRARFNPAAVGLLEFIPAANLPGRVQNFEYGTSIPQDTDSYGTRFNQGFGRRDRLDFNINVQTRRSRHAQPLGFIDRSDGGGLSSSAGWVHNFGPRRIHTFRWNFSRNRTETVPHFAYKRNVADELGINGTPDDPVNWGPPNLSFTNFGSLSDASSVLRRDQTSTLQDSMLFVKKGHNVTVGGEFRRAQTNRREFQTARGSYSFSGLMTSAFDEKNQPLAGTGYDFADFLLGFPQSSNIKFGGENTYFRSSIYAVYGQDDWRMLPNLSLNVGLRYEYFPPFTEKRDRIANLDVEPHFMGVAVVTPGTRGPYTGVFPRGLVEPDKNNVSPRIGFAWRPHGKKIDASARRLQHLLQRVHLQRVSQPPGGAASLRQIRASFHQHKAAAHPPGRLRLGAFGDHHQHVRRGPLLPGGLRADLQPERAAQPAARAGARRGVPGDERDAAGHPAAAQPRRARLPAHRRAAAADRQRRGLHVRYVRRATPSITACRCAWCGGSRRAFRRTRSTRVRNPSITSRPTAAAASPWRRTIRTCARSADFRASTRGTP